jgi:hypothetical protein
MKNNFSRTLLVILTISLFTNNILAQGLYITANAGYGFGINKNNITNYSETATSHSYDKVRLSFGKGISIGGAIGYMFNKNMGAELGLSYLIGGKTKSTYVYTDDTENVTYYGKMLKINPSFIFTAGAEKFNPYAKLGMVVGFCSINRENTENYTTGDVSVINYKWSGGMALGFYSAIGATYKLNNNLSLFGELNLISLSYAPEKMEITKATQNGTDVLPGMTTYEKEVDFVDNYTVNMVPDYTKPNKAVKINFPFGSIGFNVGIRIGLGKYVNEVQ